MSMLLLLPPSEDFSSSYWPLLGTNEAGLTMPLQIFELGEFKKDPKFLLWFSNRVEKCQTGFTTKVPLLECT